MTNKDEYTNKTYARLKIIRFSHMSGRRRYYLCECDCGEAVTRAIEDIKRGHTKSCGCLAKERVTTHGMYGTKAYRSWQKMLERCRNKNHEKYKNYGGRGINVCDDWLIFENFHRDMGDRPKGKFIDRIDNNGDYEKNNCRWSSHRQNCLNRSTSMVWKVNGKSYKRLADASLDVGIPEKTIWRRCHKGVEGYSVTKLYG